jgi:hypothetical protein
MHSNNASSDWANATGTKLHRPSHPWLRLAVLLGIGAVLVTLSAVSALANSSPTRGWEQGGGTTPPPGTVPPSTVIYLGFKTSDEIEFDDDDQEDFVYKNEDIVAFTPATGEFSIFFDGSECGLEDANLDDFEILDTGNILFTLRATFTIPDLGEVDDSDVIEYTPNPDGCGTFAFRLIGADVGLTEGSEDIDGLGIAEDDSLLISTIGTARVLGSSGELEVRDQSILKLEDETTPGTWSLYFDGEDVELIDSSEDIRSIWVDAVGDPQGNKNVYLTLSGDFDVESDNDDEGDKNDVEGCSPLSLGDETECFFFKLLDGEEVNAENQLDGLAVNFGAPLAAVTAVTASTAADIAREAPAEWAADTADFAAALAEGNSGISVGDFLEIESSIYLPLVER